jgi:hypothetical protein
MGLGGLPRLALLTAGTGVMRCCRRSYARTSAPWPQRGSATSTPAPPTALCTSGVTILNFTPSPQNPHTVLCSPSQVSQTQRRGRARSATVAQRHALCCRVGSVSVMHAGALHPLGLANPAVCIPLIPADLVSGKSVPGARLDYHDEM